MKKMLFVLFIFTGILNTSAQLSFVGFDQPFCGSPLTISYTYSNYYLGGGSGATYGYKLYRNGVEMYDAHGSMGTGEWCSDLIFINDSTGFAVGNCGMCGAYVLKTADYGFSWHYIGSSPPSYMGLYIVNANFCYLVTSPNAGQFFIEKCSDLESPSLLIYDDSINADVYRIDTIMGSSLCNIDSLNVFIKNQSGDTIDYHINLHYVPVGMNEISMNEHLDIVYPNPAKNAIIIDGTDFLNAEIYTVSGEKVVVSDSKEITIENLSRGIYFVRITHSNGEIQHSKFIKE